MYAEIDARVCHTKRECEEGKAYPHSSRHQRYEGCHAERVGRMTGAEAVLTAAISVDIMEQILHARRMRRTKTCEVGLHDVGRQLVAERHGQSYGQDYQQALSVLCIRLKEKKRNTKAIGTHNRREENTSDMESIMLPPSKLSATVVLASALSR